MNYSERAITFACEKEALVGILAVPQAAACSDIGVIVIVGGPQYRAGSHRQFTLLSRALADAGYPVLRFDYRGMGDSTGGQRDFLHVTPDIGTAIDAMQAALPGVKRITLWGLCDAASAALLYCHDTNDARVRGLCLLNPWVRSQTSLARTHIKHYYKKRLLQKEFWAKLSRGKVAFAALTGLWHTIGLVVGRPLAPVAMERQPFQRRMAAACAKFQGSILLLLSGEDYTAKEFLEYAGNDKLWKKALARPGAVRYDIRQADHTFSSDVFRTSVNNKTIEWLKCLNAQRAG